MLERITIQGINFKDYNGVDKRTGVPYKATIAGIFDGQRWYSFFDRKGVSRAWNKGDTMEFEVVVKTTPEGRDMYNISLPDPIIAMAEKLNRLERFAAKVVVFLDNNFEGWKDEQSAKPGSAPLSVDEIAKGIEDMAVAKAKIREEKNEAGTDDAIVW